MIDSIFAERQQRSFDESASDADFLPRGQDGDIPYDRVEGAVGGGPRDADDLVFSRRESTFTSGSRAYDVMTLLERELQLFRRASWEPNFCEELVQIIEIIAFENRASFVEEHAFLLETRVRLGDGRLCAGR